MARSYQFSGGLGGKKANGQRWYSSGGLGTRTNIGGPDEEDGGVRVPEHHLGEVRQPRQRAASGADTRMNSSPSTTRPGTQSPSQPQRALPGVRNFSLFGGAYTWSKAQEKIDSEDPNFNGGAGKNVLKPAVVAGKPAAVAVGKPAVVAGDKTRAAPVSASSDASYARMFNTKGRGSPPSEPGFLGLVEQPTDSYDTMAAEYRAVGAGNDALAATAAKSAGGLTRTAGSDGLIEFRPGVMYRPAGDATAQGSVSRPFDNRPQDLWAGASIPDAVGWDGTPEGVDKAFPDSDMSYFEQATRRERTDNERLFSSTVYDWMRQAVPGRNYARYTNAR